MLQTPRTKKSLGQHFLKDERIAGRIVDLLHITSEDQILEIGPGSGALTSFIAAAYPARFVLVEKDTYWAEHHKALTYPLQGRTFAEICNQDALAFSWEALTGPWKIISNLPYNVGSPLIWDIVSRTPDLRRAVFMVQKEVAQRLCAVPGSRDYGALSVWVQSYMSVTWGFVVRPGVFNPPPKVDSAVIAMTPVGPEARPRDPEALAALLRLCFQHRRKQLQSIFRKAGIVDPMSLLSAFGIVPEARPETLSPTVFQKLSLALPTL